MAVLPNELDEVEVTAPSGVVTGAVVLQKRRCPIVVVTEIPVLFAVRRVPGIEVRIGYGLRKLVHDGVDHFVRSRIAVGGGSFAQGEITVAGSAL